MRGMRQGCAACALVLVLGLPGAFAQDGQAGAGTNGNITGAGSGSAGGAPGGTTRMDPNNGGVAGTGMGDPTKGDAGKPAVSGTGNSVSGPPGQGINNGTDTNAGTKK
jgi:hypothetical protein